MDFALKVNSSVLSILIFGFSNIIAWLLSISSMAFNIVLYFTIVYYLLDMDRDIINLSCRLLPIKKEARQDVVNSLKQSVKGVFLSNFKMAIYQALYTWLILDSFSIQYVYIYALVAAFFKIVPLVSTFLLGLLGAIQMYFSNEEPLIKAIVLVCVYTYVDFKLSNDIFEREV
jgi:predicted PurR-regulated permease PerM